MDESRLNLVRLYLTQGQIDQAIEGLKSLLSEDPEIAIYHGLLAVCLLSKKRLYAAEYELSIALKLDPAEPYFHEILARIFLLKNKPSLALDQCDEALHLDPEYPEVLLLKSDIYFMLGKRNEALQCIESAAEIAPDSITITIAFGDYFYNTGEYDQSMVYAIEALGKDAGNEDANILMGKLKLIRGDISEAEYHAKFVIIQNPQSETALRLLSDIKMKKNIFLGLWWRINSRLSALSNLKLSLILITAYLFFSLCAQILSDLDYAVTSSIVSYAWILLVLYSWVALPVYYSTLRSELKEFQFNKDF